MNDNKSTQNHEKQEKTSFSTETLKCPVCGHRYEKNKTGRTKEYCSPTCQEFNKFKNAMVDRMIKINFNEKEAKTIRRELWSYCNYAPIPKKKKTAN